MINQRSREDKTMSTIKAQREGSALVKKILFLSHRLNNGKEREITVLLEI